MTYDHALTSATLAPFEDILDELEQLSREHLLFYRVQVGQVLLRHFWGDDITAYQSRDPHKNMRFELFMLKYGEDLHRYGLSKYQAKRSIQAAIVVRTLPAAVAKQLFLTQVLQLARLTDRTQRVTVAMAAIDQDWTVTQLRDAVDLVRAGLPMDADPETPGVQLSPQKRPTPKPVPGRLVTQAERLAQDVEAWRGAWQQVDASRLRRPQRLRLTAAVDALEAQVVALRASLGE